MTDKKTTWDCIYFGNYYQNDSTTKEPIKWRLLSIDGDNALILADQALWSSNTYGYFGSSSWENSNLRREMNNVFYNTAFTKDEKAAIQETTLENKDSNGVKSTNDKIFALSSEDVSNASYGFESEVLINGCYTESVTRFCMPTDYTRDTGYINDRDITKGEKYLGEVEWCLRSVGDNGCPYVASSRYYSGWTNTTSCYCIRPALNIKLSDAKWSYAGRVIADKEKYTTIIEEPTESAKPSETTKPTSKPDYKIKKPRVTNKKTTWDCIYFGNYYQDDDIFDEKKEPIKWRVLSVKGNDALILADKALNSLVYNEKNSKSITWEKSSLRKWLNNTFYKEAFNASEQSAIRPVKVVNNYNKEYGTDGGKDTKDKIFLLSYSDVCNKAYGFNNGDQVGTMTRIVSPTKYAAEDLSVTIDDKNNMEICDWWLRSPGSNGKCAMVVEFNGNVDRAGVPFKVDNYGVRPALHINLSSSTWKKAGTVSASMQNTDEELEKLSTPKKVNGVTLQQNRNYAVSVNWKKVKEKTKYEVQYCNSMNFKETKTNKVITKKTGKTSFTFYGKKNKVFYVRVRGYNEKYGRRKYGKWSDVKKIKLYK